MTGALVERPQTCAEPTVPRRVCRGRCRAELLHTFVWEPAEDFLEVRVGEPKPLELPEGEPADLVVLVGLAVLHAPLPRIDREDAQVEVSGAVFDSADGLSADCRHLDAQLLSQLASQCFERQLTILDMASRKVPDVGVPLTIRRAVTQEEEVCHAQYTDNDVVDHHIVCPLVGGRHISIVLQTASEVSCFVLATKPLPSPSIG